VSCNKVLFMRVVVKFLVAVVLLNMLGEPLKMEHILNVDPNNVNMRALLALYRKEVY